LAKLGDFLLNTFGHTGVLGKSESWVIT